MISQNDLNAHVLPSILLLGNYAYWVIPDQKGSVPSQGNIQQIT